MTKISIGELGRLHGMSAMETTHRLAALNLIEKQGGSWILTEPGEVIGGSYRESSQTGRFIVWPKTIQLDALPANQGDTVNMLTATVIANTYQLSPMQVNLILSELGWLNKSMGGWVLTDQGKKQGGVQSEDLKTGTPYVRWPDSILHVKPLRVSIDEVKGTQHGQDATPELSDASTVGFRDKYKAEYRAADGHSVRSKAEMIIDNWLYMAEIVHAYERKLPIEEELYCDFYIPAGKVYIEYWGNDTDPKYLARKEEKIHIYKEYGFNLIELNDDDVKSLDDILPRLLLKYGVQVY